MIKIVISFLFLFSFSFAGELEKAKVSTFEKILNEITLDSNNIDLPNPQYEKSEIKIENELKNDPRLYVKISAKDKYQRTKLLELGLDILEVKILLLQVL
jgi:hypothetical protein